MIRALDWKDLDEVKRIHAQHFAKEFTMPEFMQFICAFVVEDEHGIITAGGIRDIAECIAVTNLERDPRVRMDALFQLLDASKFVCRKSEFDQIYAWSRTPRWSRRMQKCGFRLSQGQSLIFDL